MFQKHDQRGASILSPKPSVLLIILILARWTKEEFHKVNEFRCDTPSLKRIRMVSHLVFVIIEYMCLQI